MNTFEIATMQGTVQAGTSLNWSQNVMDWSLNSDNTNLALVASSRLFPYLSNDTRVFKCPADNALSAVQRTAGWQRRVRSYSMNGFVGPTTGRSADSWNRGLSNYFPNYRQFIQSSGIPRPGSTVLFIDEHPDSINHGYFLENPGLPTSWTDLPGSYHNGAGGISYADGREEIHAWQYASAEKPVGSIWGPIPAAERGDYLCLAERMTAGSTTLSAVGLSSNQLLVAWSALPTNYVFQTSDSLDSVNWTNFDAMPSTSPGQNLVQLTVDGPRRFFRLKKNRETSGHDRKNPCREMWKSGRKMETEKEASFPADTDRKSPDAPLLIFLRFGL